MRGRLSVGRIPFELSLRGTGGLCLTFDCEPVGDKRISPNWPFLKKGRFVTDYIRFRQVLPEIADLFRIFLL